MLASILFPSFVALTALAASPDDWRTRSIYQLVTDRFATPDGSSPTCNTDDRRYCGGNYKGVINKLDYIQSMGFDAIWISPVVANVEGNTAYGEAFHGYWTQDINKLNDHFGSADDLKSLSDAVHKRNMYLMVDVVVNHMVATSNPPNFGSFEPFNQQSDYHSFCFIQASDYDNNQTAVEQCWLGDENLPLADINTEDPNIVSTWNSWISGLVKNYTFDGVRIDTVKHVRKDFWPEFAKSAESLSAALDYPAYFALTTGFQTTNGNLSTLAAVVQSGQSVYDNGEHYMGSFLENHDNPRFQSLTQDQALVKNAMTWPFVQDGIPVLYYGQEQGYTGGNDPANREALWLSGYGEDKPLVQHVKTLNAARKAAASTNKDFYTSSLKFLVDSTNNLAISKPPMLTLLTNEGSTSTPQWNVPNAGYSANQELIDVLTCTKVNADANGGVSIKGSGGNPQVLLPTSALAKGGSVCPDAATGAQASSARSLTVQVLGSSLAIVLSLLVAFS
ncbi:unnamed protein product [Somion occarium]|uniref:alpha-amylase n=1 Tax=Somion occarium TaxID=3059160 RepID=A0ABP1CQ60_9APHY